MKKSNVLLVLLFSLITLSSCIELEPANIVVENVDIKKNTLTGRDEVFRNGAWVYEEFDLNKYDVSVFIENVGDYSAYDVEVDIKFFLSSGEVIYFNVLLEELDGNSDSKIEIDRTLKNATILDYSIDTYWND